MDVVVFVIIIFIVAILIALGGKRTTPILLSAFLIYFGTKTIFKPKYYNPLYGHEFDFTGYNIPFGIFIIIIGVYLSWITIRSKNKIKKDT